MPYTDTNLQGGWLDRLARPLSVTVGFDRQMLASHPEAVLQCLKELACLLPFEPLTSANSGFWAIGTSLPIAVGPRTDQTGRRTILPVLDLSSEGENAEIWAQ